MRLSFPTTGLSAPPAPHRSTKTHLVQDRLRNRLILSHTLPLLALASVLGFALLYLWETYYYLDVLASELLVQAHIVTDFVPADASTWASPDAALKLVDRLKGDLPARIMLLDADGRLLASSNAPDNQRVGQILDFPVVQQALQRQTEWLVTYNPFLGQRVVDIAVPVVNANGQIVGIVRLSHSLSQIEARLVPLRWLVFLTTSAAALGALLLGLWLARSLSAPLSRLTEAVAGFTPGEPPQTLPERGPVEVRTLAASFNQVAQRLYGRELERRRLLASIVHEIGTPLGAIKAAAQALQKGGASDPQFAVELADGINSQVDRLTLLLDDLALLGASELKGFTLSNQWLNLKEIVGVQCRAYAYLVKQKQITLTYQIQDEVPCVSGDRERICQILSNLISNACKYTPAGGSIHVSLAAERGQYALLKVADSGPGIAPDEQSRIFTYFYRSPQLRDLYQGMGIGLALSRQLAEAHGGSLTVESTPGGGATFLLRLPLDVQPGECD